MADRTRESDQRERPCRYQRGHIRPGRRSQEPSASGRSVSGGAGSADGSGSVDQTTTSYLVGVCQCTPTAARPPEVKASDDPGLFVLALARRPSPVSKRRGLRSWYKFLCMHKPVLSTALATGWSGPSPLRCACVLRAVRGLSDTRMQRSSSSSFDVIMHLAGVERGADARRSPLTLRTCPPSTPGGRHWMGLSSPTCGGRP